MKIESTNENGTIVLSISGKMVTGEGEGRLLEAVQTQLSAGHKDVVLDLGELTYIDSGGIGEIVQCRSVVVEGSGTLKLRNLPKQVYDRLSITRLVSLFESADES